MYKLTRNNEVIGVFTSAVRAVREQSRRGGEITMPLPSPSELHEAFAREVKIVSAT